MSQEKNILLLIILIYFRAHIYSLELHHSNECFYLMKTPFTRITIPRCPWYMRTKRQSPSNIFLSILICFLAQISIDFKRFNEFIFVFLNIFNMDKYVIQKNVLHGKYSPGQTGTIVNDRISPYFVVLPVSVLRSSISASYREKYSRIRRKKRSYTNPVYWSPHAMSVFLRISLPTIVFLRIRSRGYMILIRAQVIR